MYIILYNKQTVLTYISFQKPEHLNLWNKWIIFTACSAFCSFNLDGISSWRILARTLAKSIREALDIIDCLKLVMVLCQKVFSDLRWLIFKGDPPK